MALSVPDTAMTVAQFLEWVVDQPQRYELDAGHPVAVAPERVLHVDVKNAARLALRDAIRRAGLTGCRVFGDGLGLRIDDRHFFQPDAMVRCGPPLDGNPFEIADPIVVVEVASPSTRGVDTGRKLEAYVAVPSVRHYLVLLPEDRRVIHHARIHQAGPDTGPILTTILADGTLTLDPPGLAIPVATLFEEP